MKRLLILAGVATMAASANANLIFNGDFEGYTMTAGDGSYVNVNNTSYGANAFKIPSWTYYGVDGNGNENNVALLSAGYLGQLTQEVDLSGGTDIIPSGIFQSIATVANQWYQLKFDVWTGGGSYTGGVNMDVHDGGVGGSTLTAATNLQGNAGTGAGSLLTYTYNFMATGAITTVAFSQYTSNVSQIDNVEVNAVPEPFTMSLGLAGVGLFIRRRNAKKA